MPAFEVNRHPQHFAANAYIISVKTKFIQEVDFYEIHSICSRQNIRSQECHSY